MEVRTPFWRLLAAVPFLILFFSEPAARQEARVSSLPGEAPQFDYLNSDRFPNVVSSYTVSFVPDPRLDNSGRVQNLIVDGKLMLALEDAIGLAPESNLDIAVARCNLPIVQTDLLRANGGGAIRGVTGPGVLRDRRLDVASGRALLSLSSEPVGNRVLPTKNQQLT
jgi:hypothetical protein